MKVKTDRSGVGDAPKLVTVWILISSFSLCRKAVQVDPPLCPRRRENKATLRKRYDKD